MLEAAHATWRDLGDAAIADAIGGQTGAPKLVIADLSPLPRLGFKGRGTLEAMRARGVTLEVTPNRAFRQADGGLCLVLAPGEVILLSNLAGDGAHFDRWLADWRIEDEERTYPLLRRDSHAWLAVAGADAPAMFAKICAVDLRPEKFANLDIAQTSAAKMTAIITRADIGNVITFHVLADSAAALYFSTCLLDAAEEFQGRFVGIKALQDLGAA
jgi:sarcosine oxidase subunit gamma